MSNPQSFQDSLSQLGIGFVRGRIIAFVAALVAGLVVARVLPLFYGEFAGRILDQINGCDISCRDTINKFAITLVTIGVSFAVAFVISRRTRA